MSKPNVYVARRNFSGPRGWVYEGTLMYSQYPQILPRCSEMEDEGWEYFWEETSLCLDVGEQPKFEVSNDR